MVQSQGQFVSDRINLYICYLTFFDVQQPKSNPVRSHRKMITTEAVERYNRAAVSIMEEADSPAVIWTSVQSLVEEFYDDMPDGLHIPVKALKQAIQARVLYAISMIFFTCGEDTGSVVHYVKVCKGEWKRFPYWETVGKCQMWHI